MPPSAVSEFPAPILSLAAFPAAFAVSFLALAAAAYSSPHSRFTLGPSPLLPAAGSGAGRCHPSWHLQCGRYPLSRSGCSICSCDHVFAVFLVVAASQCLDAASSWTRVGFACDSRHLARNCCSGLHTGCSCLCGSVLSRPPCSNYLFFRKCPPK